MAIDKSTWNKKVKVSQSTIDDIKKLGMDKALKMAKMNAKSPQAGLVAEYQEATRRLYGDKRFSAATSGTSAKKPSTSYSPVAKKASTSYSPQKMKATPKKGVSGATFLKGVAGTAAAAGILIAGKGKGVGLAAKLAPGLMKNKVAQAALTGEIKKTAAKTVAKKVAPKTVSQSGYDAMVAAKRGQAAAAAGKSVTPEQFSAMSAAAKAAAKKAPVKKTAAKKAAAPAAKKTGLSAGRRFDANAPKAKAPKPKK